VSAVLALPLFVTLIIPALLVRGLPLRGALSGRGLLLAVGGLLLLAAGLALVAWTVALFFRVGQGTLAPWDPPRRLVLGGPYLYVRNPMITGVFAILLGEAAFFRAWPLLAWFAVFVLVNSVYMPVVEEPGLARRFGPAYDRYRCHVPRWLPRLRPWTPPDEPADDG
jgi:protein-S-isoprenylcysteine O-methyltransferase Ste14